MPWPATEIPKKNSSPRRMGALSRSRIPVAPDAAEPAPGPPPGASGPVRSFRTRTLEATSRPTTAPPAAHTTSAVRQSVRVIRYTMLTGPTA